MTSADKDVVIIGYSGHAFVAIEILVAMGLKPVAYCDVTEKANNPHNLKYLGSEGDQTTLDELKGRNCFVGIGDNNIRKSVTQRLTSSGVSLVSAVHPSAVVSSSATLGPGVMIGALAAVNAHCVIGAGVICNTRSCVEHECVLGEFSHVGPGATLSGNVKLGALGFVGSNSVVKEGVSIGSGAVVGAGAVVVRDVTEETTVVGNPAKELA